MSGFDGFARLERDGWKRETTVAAYVDKFAPVTDAIARAMVAASPALEGRDVMDLCCGQGSLSALALADGARVTAVDLSQEMLARARSAAPEAELRQADAADLPFPDASFDVVFCNFGMMHLPDRIKGLSEVARVLRTGGRFLMSSWATPDVSPAFGVAFGAIRGNADMSRAPAQPDFFQFARPDEASSLFEAAGLAMVDRTLLEEAWTVERPEAFFEIFSTATVAAAMLINSQRPAVVERIRDDMARAVADRYAAGDVWRVPVTAVMLSAAPT